ncbi:hypothetical protein SETIT_5G151300v2 [Setaria italica]|uniref:Uncharacterized protein n=1 Tax=Setaria italica TaxID=4555 RepID=A0A368R4Y4_SETIT|nr:hypothetical protein SETIT_5G151300v2 [Setaria italica]
MSRSIDSDYLDFSHMGGFDMEEIVRKFIELPVKYLDSAHDKAVEFIEDVQEIFFAPFTDDEVLNEEDQSSSNVITESSPTSVESELVGPNTEASTPASLITAENSSTGCVGNDAHGTESFSSSESTGLSLMNHVYPENTSEGGCIEANDLRLLPEAEDTSPSEIYDSSEEVILWNPETSVKPQPRGLTAIPQDKHAPHALETDQVAEQAGHCSGYSVSSVCSREIPLENFRANYEEEVVLHSANDPVGVTVHDSTTITEDDYVPDILHKDQQAELHCSAHSDILVDSAVFFQALLLEGANYEEKMVSYSANDPVEATQDNYVPQALNKEEQAGLHCSGHSDILVDSATFFEALLLEDSTANSEEQMVSNSANAPVEATTHGSSAGTSISHESSSDFPNCADDPNMTTDTMVKSADIVKSVDIKDLRDGQEHMENDEIEVAPVPQRNNASFQKMFMRNLSSKLRWSKKQVSTHQAMPAGSQDSENLGCRLHENFGYRLVSSSDDLESDWEVL